MGIISTAAKMLLQAGVTGEALIEAIEQIEDAGIPSMDDAVERKRAYDRAYQQRRRTTSDKKKGPPDPLKEKTKNSPDGEQKTAAPVVFPDLEDLDFALDAYNQVAAGAGMPKVLKLTESRKAKLRRRLIDCGSLDTWYDVCRQLQKASFLHGENDRGWRADFDFLLQESSFNRLREGFYDGKEKVRGRSNGRHM